MPVGQVTVMAVSVPLRADISLHPAPSISSRMILPPLAAAPVDITTVVVAVWCSTIKMSSGVVVPTPTRLRSSPAKRVAVPTVVDAERVVAPVTASVLESVVAPVTPSVVENEPDVPVKPPVVCSAPDMTVELADAFLIVSPERSVN